MALAIVVGEGGAPDEPAVCDQCGDQASVWPICECYGITGFLGYADNSSPCSAITCQTSCAYEYSRVFSSNPVEAYCFPDGDTPTTGASTADCNAWNPGDYISSSGYAYTIDYGFAYDLWTDAAALLQCDTAKIDFYQGTGFKVESASTGDFLYKIGLRNDDVLVEVNGYTLATPADAALAYADLWLDQGEQYYEMEIERNASPITLEWDLVAMKP